MAVYKDVAPPDGYYWWTPRDPERERQIVEISRRGGDIDVWFMGTDVNEVWGDVEGTFVPVVPPRE